MSLVVAGPQDRAQAQGAGFRGMEEVLWHGNTSVFSVGYL
jgi:hypothetical protein